MKWRNTAIYLIIFLLLGGYYYYFEVVKKEQKEAAERESRLVFSFSPESVSTIDVEQAKTPPVRLEKQDFWKITQPVSAEVDRANLDSFVGALRKLEVMRKVGAAGKPESYGLTDPSLSIRIQAGDRKMELLVGQQNPTGDARYAKTAAGDDIFLIDQMAFNNLNKGLKDLRRKELFSWQSDQVTAVDVEWQTGEKVRIERREGKWVVPGQPGLKIKSTTLENLLDQIHFLRATDFLDESARPSPPAVRLVFHLKSDKTSELVLGTPDQATKQVAATSSELPVPVKVGSYFLNDVPKSAAALEDRSLLSLNEQEVREIKWKRAGTGGSVVRIDESKWSLGESPVSKPLEDPWPVAALLEDLGNAEYTEKVEGSADVQGLDANRVELLGADRKIASLSWGDLPEGEKGEVTIRVEHNGETKLVKMELESFRQTDEALGELAKAPSAK